MKTKHKKFKPAICECCTQTKEYALPLDRGTALLVLAIFNRIRDKGINRVHTLKEMVRDPKEFANYRDMVAGGWMTVRMEGNRTRARFHGLIAFADGGGNGEYVLTKKGARFLLGEAVPRVAVIDKTTGHKAYYLEEETDRITFGELMKKETPFWDLSDSRLNSIAEYPAPGVETAPLFAV